MAQVRNVVVFSAGEHGYALELGWVREIFSLRHLTPVPYAPEALAGVTNFRGALISVIDLPRDEAPAQGGSALLLEVDRVSFAIRADLIDEVSSLDFAVPLRDSRGREIQLVDPRSVLENVVHLPAKGPR